MPTQKDIRVRTRLNNQLRGVPFQEFRTIGVKSDCDRTENIHGTLTILQRIHSRAPVTDDAWCIVRHVLIDINAQATGSSLEIADHLPALNLWRDKLG